MVKDEQLFVKNFALRNKKDRLLGFFGNDKNRDKALLEIEHFSEIIFDFRYAEVPKQEKWTVDEIISRLKLYGSPSGCYLISNCQGLDRKNMDLENAIKEVVGIGMGTLVSCLPGRLVYYESEFGIQVIFRK